MSLNPNQQIIVDTRGHLAVVAIPGSGKTHTIIARAIKLLNENPSYKLAMVTFTRAAALEMIERLGEGVDMDRIKVNTFHSIALEQLRNSGRQVKTIAGGEQNAFIFRAINSTGSKYKLDVIREAVEHYNGMLYPKEDIFPCFDVFKEYKKLLTQHDCSDFADLARDCALGLKDGTVTPLDATHLLVDEFQDSDNTQYHWIMSHHNNGAEITIVGDDDQSIYGWRGGMGFKGFVDFQKETGAKAYALDTCYRCRPEILVLADNLIQHNKKRIPKILKASKESGGVTRSLEFADELNEADEIAKYVAGNPQDWAVLGRTNRILDKVQATLNSHQIPCKRLGGRSIWDTQGAVLYMAGLTAIGGGPTRGLENLLVWANESEMMVQTINREMKNTTFDHLPTHVIEEMGQAGRMMQKAWCAWRSEIRKNNPGAAIDGLVNWMKTAMPKKESDINFASIVSDRVKKMNPQLSLPQRVSRLRDAVKAERDDGVPKVTLSTMHSSKGLQFNSVWLPSINHGVIPSTNSEDIEEERRLLFVGITRAEEKLYISHKKGEASEFIGQIVNC
ncbi:MAG TPA: ATP-dependent helicase [Porticoccus sp.]|nr:ATP-dependent helicase [Porticoccus sp.]